MDLRSPLVALLAICAGTASAGSCMSERGMRQQLNALARPQGERIVAALDRIDGTDRQLLALRSYLRLRSLDDRWSWTQAQIDAYRESDEYRALLAEIEKISARFAADNPGYTLYANTEVRSLDTQIERWNENRSVGAIAADLYAAVCDSGATRPQALRSFLLEWQPEFPAPLAAPGLSPHGRARAIDFQVQQGARLVAGTSTAAIEGEWVAGGWAQKLQAAIAAASSKFHGPLASPNEPWHYEYRP
ncbi:MAG TPA: hypothetical protein PKE27_12930 [Povalibacter sp.]|uniref:hypothetical protein n=1 Tax=Povalibacter sp. TaxID=1962978 RepID=UPI002B626D46|nr:hypothetical protein [Povalibacter sp.]HMN45480.1 hypothetical protein [Povalibacter sp.]